MFRLYRRTPDKATENERQRLVQLVAEGGAVTAERVRAGIPRAEVLVFCSTGGRVVGVAALKVPVQNYRDGLASGKKANIPLPAARYPLELGYVAVDPEWRGLGLGPLLCAEVVILARGRGLFATTGADIMRDRVLPRLAFKPAGSPWQGASEPVFLMLRDPMADGEPGH